MSGEAMTIALIKEHAALAAEGKATDQQMLDLASNVLLYVTRKHMKPSASQAMRMMRAGRECIHALGFELQKGVNHDISFT